MTETVDEQPRGKEELRAEKCARRQAVPEFFRDSRFDELLGERKVLLIDGGAKGGLRKEWLPVQRLVRLIAVEPLWPADIDDRSEIASATKVAHKKKIYASDTSFVPMALGRECGVRSFYRTRGGSMSSFLRPDPQRARLYGLQRSAEVRHTVAIETTTLDTIVEDHRLRFVDFVKLDTQGSELEILRGGARTIGQLAFGLRIETSFVRLYESQPLFADIDSFVRQQGFEFIDFTHLKRYRRVGPTVTTQAGVVRRDERRSRGQLVVADALYFRAPSSAVAHIETLISADRHRYVAGALIACLTYACLDYALELLALARPLIDPRIAAAMRELLHTYPA